MVEIYLDKNKKSYIEFHHNHGEPQDLFLLLKVEKPLIGGEDITWSGELPKGKARLWVMFPFLTKGGNQTHGTMCLHGWVSQGVVNGSSLRKV